MRGHAGFNVEPPKNGIMEGRANVALDSKHRRTVSEPVALIVNNPTESPYSSSAEHHCVSSAGEVFFQMARNVSLARPFDLSRSSRAVRITDSGNFLSLGDDNDSFSLGETSLSLRSSFDGDNEEVLGETPKAPKSSPLDWLRRMTPKADESNENEAKNEEQVLRNVVSWEDLDGSCNVPIKGGDDEALPLLSPSSCLLTSKHKRKSSGIVKYYDDSMNKTGVVEPDRVGRKSCEMQDKGDEEKGDRLAASQLLPQLCPERENAQSRAIRIAAAFLMDYEFSRPATLFHNPDNISSAHLLLHDLKFSSCWKWIIRVATICLFAASSLDGSCNMSGRNGRMNRQGALLLACTLFPVVVYTIDMIILAKLKQPKLCSGAKGGNTANLKNRRTYFRDATVLEQSPTNEKSCDLRREQIQRHYIEPRVSRSRLWTLPLSLFLAAYTLETSLSFFVVDDVTDDSSGSNQQRTRWTGALKPIALFYLFPEARDALEALRAVAPALVKVTFIELFVVLIFGSLACQLYGNEFGGAFGGLRTSFISMFELSTTVVNPGMWMAVYNKYKSAALFFALFLVTSIFYFHSLVLSVVFQSYMQAVSAIRERYSSDREDAARLAFQTLSALGSNDSVQHAGMEKNRSTENGSSNNDNGSKQNLHHASRSPAVPVVLLKKVFKILRPHYCAVKINALTDIMNVEGRESVDFHSFRARVPKALSISLRSTRETKGLYSFAWNWFAVSLALSNMLFVMIFSDVDSSLEEHSPWMRGTLLPIGAMLTFFSMLDLIARFSAGCACSAVPAVKLNGVFDTLATMAVFLSISGLFLHISPQKEAASLQLLFIGRALDLVRVLRLFGIVRDLVRRTKEVFPALVGPLVLLVTAVHAFTYLGILFWGGKVEVGRNRDINPYYDLNNFNSYTSGMMTMFQVLIVNDWHEIARVFIPVSSPGVVYPFFIGGNLIGVSILLNVLTAFFVGAFVSKSSDGRGVNRLPSERKAHKRKLDVVSRPNFDMIMRTVAGADYSDDEDAKQACRILEVFENLTPGRQKVGYLVCCQQSQSRYGNRRFQMITDRFIDNDLSHVVISEMHSELTNFLSGRSDCSVYRRYPLSDEMKSLGEEEGHTLEITASLMKESPPISLFVARVLGADID